MKEKGGKDRCWWVCLHVGVTCYCDCEEMDERNRQEMGEECSERQREGEYSE